MPVFESRVMFKKVLMIIGVILMFDMAYGLQIHSVSITTPDGRTYKSTNYSEYYSYCNRPRAKKYYPECQNYDSNLVKEYGVICTANGSVCSNGESVLMTSGVLRH